MNIFTNCKTSGDHARDSIWLEDKDDKKNEINDYKNCLRAEIECLMNSSLDGRLSLSEE